MARESLAPYRCLATIEVPTGQVDLYDQLLCKAADVFKTHAWRLLARGQGAAMFDTAGAPPGLQRKLLHVWSIPDFNSLPTVMAYAADDPNYVAAQALTVREAQNLYVALRWDDPIDLPDTPVHFYMMESLQVVNSEQAREDFATYMDSAVYRMSTDHGWKIQLAGNAATGEIDRYVNVWGIDDVTKLDQAITQYRGAASWSAAVSWVSTSLWTPRPLPCFDASGAVVEASGTTG